MTTLAEKQRHAQLMKFMQDFRISMEDKIANTNNKLDNKLEEISEEIKGLNGIIDKNEEDTNNVLA